MAKDEKIEKYFEEIKIIRLQNQNLSIIEQKS